MCVVIFIHSFMSSFVVLFVGSLARWLVGSSARRLVGSSARWLVGWFSRWFGVSQVHSCRLSIRCLFIYHYFLINVPYSLGLQRSLTRSQNHRTWGNLNKKTQIVNVGDVQGTDYKKKIHRNVSCTAKYIETAY